MNLEKHIVERRGNQWFVGCLRMQHRQAAEQKSENDGFHGVCERRLKAAFVISYTLLKNISASLKSGKTRTAPSADNRVARLAVPMPMNEMPTLRHA